MDVSNNRSTTTSSLNANGSMPLPTSSTNIAAQLPYHTIDYATLDVLQFATCANIQSSTTVDPLQSGGTYPGPTEMDHTPTIKRVFETASILPLSCCHAIQTRRRTRAATQGTPVDKGTVLSGPVHQNSEFTEKFVMIIEPFQLIVGAGDITGMTVPAILSPNNEHLDESEGVAQRIIRAGGTELALECQSQKRIYTVLPAAAVVHTSAGNMRPRIKYVVHVVWPKHNKYSDKEAFHTILVNCFVKCLRFTSDVLQVLALAIPAEGLETRDTPPLTIASALYSALKKYNMELVRSETTPTLRTVYIVTDDSETLFYKLFQLLSAEPPQPVPVRPTPGLEAYRRRRLIEWVEKRAQLWTPEIIARKQKKDPNLNKVADWLTSGSRPDWNEVRGSSPLEKAYWNQYESLSLVSGVIYKTISPETDAKEEFMQLLLPCRLKPNSWTQSTKT